MAKGKDVRAGGAFVELTLKNTLRSGLKKASAMLRAFRAGVETLGKRLAMVGTAALTGFGVAAKVFDTMGSNLYDASRRTGKTVEELSALKYAAEQSGVGFDTVLAAIGKAQKGLGHADFGRIADELAAIQDPAERARAAMEIFGRGGAELLPMLVDGSAGLEEMARRAKELGIIMSGEDARAADEFGDALADLGKQAKAALFQIGAAVATAIKPYLAFTIAAAAKTIDFLKANRKLVATILAVTVVVTATGAALFVAAKAIGIIVAIGSAMIATWGAIVAVIAALTTPIGLVIAGLTALSVWFARSTKIGGRALDWLKGKFKEFGNWAIDVLGAVGAALAGGDFELAARVMWAGVVVVWKNGINTLLGLWEDFKQAMFFDILDIILGVDPGDAHWDAKARRGIALMDSERELKAARDDLAAAMAKARALRPLALGPGGNRFGGNRDDDHEAGMKQAAKLVTRGTFNVMGVRGLLSKDINSKILNVNKAMLNHLKQIEQNTDKNLAAFFG